MTESYIIVMMTDDATLQKKKKLINSFLDNKERVRNVNQESNVSELVCPSRKKCRFRIYFPTPLCWQLDRIQYLRGYTIDWLEVYTVSAKVRQYTISWKWESLPNFRFRFKFFWQSERKADERFITSTRCVLLFILREYKIKKRDRNKK